MRFSIQSVMFISCVLGLTGCSAAVGSEGSDGQKGEATATTSEALNPSCGRPTIAFNGLTSLEIESGLSVPVYNFVGWCFNGGDSVYVEVVDDTNGGEVLASGYFTAGPDGNSNTWFPGSISGGFTVYLATPTPGRGDHLRFLAIDFLIGTAQSSCFTAQGNAC
jgi:hypothetical protein